MPDSRSRLLTASAIESASPRPGSAPTTVLATSSAVVAVSPSWTVLAVATFSAKPPMASAYFVAPRARTAASSLFSAILVVTCDHAVATPRVRGAGLAGCSAATRPGSSLTSWSRAAVSFSMSGRTASTCPLVIAQ
ncbi:hypothetical protein GXP74_29760 [Streptacidiphilus sp. P02-A3a]|nr:hypothetical protein [Streptacidiphilus sp. P02-A3a]QMU71804.1 hypothetical protein GXP74_29760 [Streptacidiphilus sp. P02-A3a]